ncbi:GNAT family N-acetyltransferase [Cytobacillus sp. S13-E01]|uniref:GNAT family N-acetyltransferase n=1 Tax=Cytobacillus sp. S13-E01 TaxID=3031326 RepID=UPI0023D83331|nr:GNAT family N-acetyltransferase [Cytobacillus sp. S13-E01]MDF0725497.1 GNAT family N-acetyltransferase [Cytobacillus sp. S13-E01]
MKIRNALTHEIEFIRKQRVTAYGDHAHAIPLEHWNALKKAISSDADSKPGVELLVAELAGEIVGSVALFPPQTDAYEGFIEELDYSEIRLLAVSPEVRGKGVASALIAECIRRTKAKGFNAIGLHTAEFMESAIKLYERIGFERLPQYDFEPAGDGIIVKAFTLSI